MNPFTSCEGFEWDEGNLKKNWEKHRVRFYECEQVFFNQSLVVASDEPHSGSEARHYALGQTDRRRLLFIVFTIRKNRVRVISARDMSKKERKMYHEQIEKGAEIQE